MILSNEDLELLRNVDCLLKSELDNKSIFTKEDKKLKQELESELARLIVKMDNKKIMRNKKSLANITKKRKENKMYGRSYKEKMAHTKALENRKNNI